MAELIKERMTVANEQELVVFLIGMRVNKVLKVQKWTPVAASMTRMLKELKLHPEMGFLGGETTLNFPTTVMIQYWRSFEDLAVYAGNRDAVHLPAWREFNRQVGSNGDVGIWHETYRIPAGHYEAVYNNMPAFGLGKVFPLIPATGQRESARTRMATRQN
ncbi:DUF4188 domain-containing protein [Dictyobacter arantiisoli]|uniref:Transcriptional regulator n=1 Tax=Dictyobacter arantiisoli TaxID=2014874 RepID=A0A5A5TDY6_9CHLR|nr:DUF4188 domain-containing protein [Dictyobacter arantiisoli]GCF09761.1 transcriptional regulator [Dictyobacter arantiisoli]